VGPTDTLEAVRKIKSLGNAENRITIPRSSSRVTISTELLGIFMAVVYGSEQTQVTLLSLLAVSGLLHRSLSATSFLHSARSGCLLLSWFTLHLEDGASTFLGNISEPLPDYTPPHLRSDPRENLRCSQHPRIDRLVPGTQRSR
jgi:hypothetical protein